MIIYQVSKKNFFISNGVDYAAAVNMEEDVKLFTCRRKAEKKFNELVNSYSAAYNVAPKVVNHIGAIYWSTEINNYNNRVVIEFIERKTN